MKPSAYKHIAAWCRVNEIPDSNRRTLQRLAAREHAPIDAAYRDHNGTWVPILNVGTRTRMAIEVELNRGK